MTLRLTGAVADAEDAVQETFLRAWRFIGSFRGQSAVSTWLCRIAINASRDLAHKRRGEPLLEEQVRGEAADPAPDPGTRRQLMRALRRLSEGYREVLVMHDVLGMSHEEIGQVLSVEPGTSKSQLHKARAKMREILTAERPTGPGLRAEAGTSDGSQNREVAP